MKDNGVWIDPSGYTSWSTAQARSAQLLLDSVLCGVGQLVAALATRGGRGGSEYQGAGASTAAAATDLDKLIIRILADRGARVGELLGFQLNDLVVRDRKPLPSRVRPGRQGAPGPFIPRLWRRVKRYIERGRPRNAGHAHIFVSLRRDRRTATYEPLSKSGVGQLVRVRAEQAGVRKRVILKCFGIAMPPGRSIT